MMSLAVLSIFVMHAQAAIASRLRSVRTDGVMCDLCSCNHDDLLFTNSTACLHK
jgi:hypothetical protein